MCNADQSALAAAAFEELALAFGGLIATYPIPDEAVWDFCRAVDAIHGRLCARCRGHGLAGMEDPEEAPHPAIVHLLSQLHGRRAVGQVER